MEQKKINIAELLKDCPKGMELDCVSYDNVEFDYVEQSPESTYPIHCLMKTNGRYSALVFTHNGCNDRHPNAKCVIFPKGKTTWEGFVPPCKFKDGDVYYIKTEYHEHIFIFKVNEDYKYIHKYVNLCEDNFYTGKDPVCAVNNVKEIRFATEEEKTKLFQVIKDNGYKWNAETKTLEKLVEPEFKVGDRIKRKDSNEDIVLITDITDDYYIVETKYGMEVTISINIQNKYKLVPNKFDISTLKPFDKVLVRVCDTDKWIGDFYMRYDDTDTEKEFPYNCVGGIWSYCIPYESNEYLLGTTDDCDEFYKTWG